MIEGKNRNRSEQAYREITLDSSSSLKIFALDKRKYYRKFIINEELKDDDSDSKASVMGKLVETLLLEPELFDDKFHMSACVNAPTGLGLAFVEALYQYTTEATDEHGNVTRTFEDISRDAYEKAGYKLSYETVINKFIGSDSEIYYNEIRTVRANNLTVVTADDVANAERIVEGLKTNEFTSEIVNLVDSKRYSIKNQFQVEGYDVDGHKFKSMIDKVIVDHFKRTIQIYDLKCVWAVEGFYNEYYLYRRAYIQAYLYYRAMESLTEDKESEYYGYEVEPPRFLVCDSINYYAPLIYELTKEDLKDAYEGFEYKGRQYEGVKSLISNLQWALDNAVWNISRENYENKGRVKLIKRENGN